MDPRTLAEFIANTLDSTYGPNEEGFIDAGREVDRDSVFVTYTDDEFGVTTKYRLTLEVVE
jgi:hypothetical protein